MVKKIENTKVGLWNRNSTMVKIHGTVETTQRYDDVNEMARRWKRDYKTVKTHWYDGENVNVRWWKCSGKIVKMRWHANDCCEITIVRFYIAFSPSVYSIYHFIITFIPHVIAFLHCAARVCVKYKPCKNRYFFFPQSIDKIFNILSVFTFNKHFVFVLIYLVQPC
jgi:hypothetical protein